MLLRRDCGAYRALGVGKGRLEGIADDLVLHLALFERQAPHCFPQYAEAAFARRLRPEAVLQRHGSVPPAPPQDADGRVACRPEKIGRQPGFLPRDAPGSRKTHENLLHGVLAGACHPQRVAVQR